jgi:hypothetical protein
MQFNIAYQILTPSILSGVTPLGVSSLPGRSSTQKTKHKAAVDFDQ